ncbi:MAG TPA: hypothetical protein VNB90_14125 [Cytophagaceae bacterium]|nr:hypothetical protein [Cytophagaceae bacterium]
MYNLLFAVLFTSWLLISFRVFDLFKIDHLQAIIFNYQVCMVTGFFFYHNYEKIAELHRLETWILWALGTGLCFLPTFYLMAYTVKKISVTVSTIASKISLIIPVSISVLYLNSASSFSLVNSIGLLLGFAAIVMTSMRKEEKSEITMPKSKFAYFLPLLVFLGGGLVDVLVNISNYKFLPVDKSSLFPFFAFSASAFTGTVVLLYRMIFLKERLQFRNFIGGVILGIPNYLSIYFLLRALRDFDNNGALIFPVLNICVILLNSLVAIIFFKERTNSYNLIGLALALCSLVFMMAG